MNSLNVVHSNDHRPLILNKGEIVIYNNKERTIDKIENGLAYFSDNNGHPFALLKYIRWKNNKST